MILCEVYEEKSNLMFYTIQRCHYYSFRFYLWACIVVEVYLGIVHILRGGVGGERGEFMLD